jgi:hypothetical protein
MVKTTKEKTMTKPTRVEINCATGEQTVVELTAAEIAELDQLRAKAEADRVARQAEEDAKAEAKASALAKLAKLGLSEDEAKAIAG